MYWKDDVVVIAENEKDITNMFEEMNNTLKEHLNFTYLFNHKYVDLYGAEIWTILKTEKAKE